MNLWLIAIGLYLAVSLILAGAFIENQYNRPNPEYILAVTVPFCWPFLVGFAAFKWWVNHRRGKQ